RDHRVGPTGSRRRRRPDPTPARAPVALVRSAGRVVAALLGLAIGGAAVLLLREATLSTHQPLAPDSRVAVVVDVATRNRERDQSQDEMVDALFTFCRLEVTSDLEGEVREIAPDRYLGVLRPGLDDTNRRQFRGCMEDWTLDGLTAHVRSIEDLPPP